MNVILGQVGSVFEVHQSRRACLARLLFQLPRLVLLVMILPFALLWSADEASEKSLSIPGFKTDFSRRIAPTEEFIATKVEKGGIPSLSFVSYLDAKQSVSTYDREEAVVVVTDYSSVPPTAKAFPLRILIWHEVVNDGIGKHPIAVTYCPLINGVAVFDRRYPSLSEPLAVLEFNVSGILRRSDSILYDTKTETLWQQITGRGLVGDYAGFRLHAVPHQVMSVADFFSAWPNGLMMAPNTGHIRDYGGNPYPGNDQVDLPANEQLFPQGALPELTNPRRMLVGVPRKNKAPLLFSLDRLKDSNGVISFLHNNRPVSVLSGSSVRAPLSHDRFEAGTPQDAIGVFYTHLGSRRLDLRYNRLERGFIDHETGGLWTINGLCVDGPDEGQRLQPVLFYHMFAFAWAAFYPDAEYWVR